MKRTNWKKALLCIVLCLSLVLSFTGCGKTENVTSDTQATTDAVYGDASKCTLCPVKEYCCFCYQYGDCVCDEVEESEENSKVTDSKDETANDSSKGNNSKGNNSKVNSSRGDNSKVNSSKVDSSKDNSSKDNESNSDTQGKFDPKTLKGKTITIMRNWEPYTSGNNTAHDNWNKRVKELEDKYDIDIVEKKWSATIEQEILAGVKPAGQLYQVNADWATDYARQGYITDLNDAMEKTGIDMKSDIYDAFGVQLSNYNNKQYAIGVEEGKMLSVVVYNKNLTSQFADIEKLMDENKWTWDAMTDIAKKVKAKYPDKWGISVTQKFGVYGMVASNGSHMVSIGEDGTLGSNLKDKNVREALDQIYNWIHVDKVATVPESGASWDYMLKELMKGNIAFAFHDSYCYSVLKEGMNGDEYGIAYLPMGPSVDQYYACRETNWPYVIPTTYADQADELLFIVDALYQFHPGYDKDRQFSDLYVRSFTNSATYNRVKKMYRILKPAAIVELGLGSDKDYSTAMSSLFEGKTTVGAFIDTYHSKFDTYMKDTYKNLKFTGKIN